MDITNWLWWIWVLGAGFGIGVFFYGGLWITVNQLTKTAFVAPLFLLSFFGRTLLSTFGFYLLIDSQFENAVIAMIGFLLARIVMVRGRGGPHLPLSVLRPPFPLLSKFGEEGTQGPESLH